MSLFKVRDLRKKNQFIVDDVYLNSYAKVFGSNGTAVYLSLCRRVNKEQTCFPSEKLIAKDHGISDRTVRKFIKLLRYGNLIGIDRVRSKSGKWLHNEYTLFDKSVWKKPEEIFSFGIHRKIDPAPEEDFNNKLEKQIPPKDAQNKESHKKDDSHSQELTEKVRDLANAYKNGNRKFKPYFDGYEMRWSRNMWWVIKEGTWKEFAGSEKDIEWR